MDFYDAADVVSRSIDHLHRLPGSAIVVRYVKSSYQNDPIRSVVELLLFLFAVRYLLAPRYSTKEKALQLTNEEIDELVDEWEPEPLVTAMTAVERAEEENRPVFTGPSGPKVRLLTGRTVTNLASINYYNTNSSASVKERAVSTMRTYGVGPCSAPNFYGTQAEHLTLDTTLAAFLRVPAAIVYAQAFAAISSVIPAFAKRGDIIVADEGCNYAIRMGLNISRSNVRFYAHNDLTDLERVLAEIAVENAHKPLTRRFIVTEGLFEDTGVLTDLSTLVALKTKYKYRLVLDETHSFGVLGATGRGLTEHALVDPCSVDILVGSLAHAVGAGGGFCAGAPEVVDHQRIWSHSYLFSASLPAVLASAAGQGLGIVDSTASTAIPHLRAAAAALRRQLDRSEHLTVISAPESPRVLFLLKRRFATANEDEKVLMTIVQEALAGGVLITRCKHHIPTKEFPHRKMFGTTPAPTIAATVTVGHSLRQADDAGRTIRKAVARVVGVVGFAA